MAEVSEERLRRALRRSHERQFNGEDYQMVANEIAEELGIEWEDDQYEELCSSPEPGCECGFCAHAAWID